MSSNGSSSRHQHQLGNFRRSNALVSSPKSAMRRPHSAGSKPKPSKGAKRKGSPLAAKIAAVFRRERNTEDGTVPVRPSCFADDDRYQRRSVSPEGTGKSNSRNGKESKSGPMWRPKVRGRKIAEVWGYD